MSDATYISPELGERVTCVETGKQFVVARAGCSFNYARTSQGELLSDEGVDIRQRRDLLNRSAPFFCYVSGDGRTVTGWKGNILGCTTWSNESRNNWGSKILHVRVVDVHGGLWHGKGAGTGMCITLRPSKGAR